MIKFVLVICSLFVINVAAKNIPAPNDDHVKATIHNGRFWTRLDHFRPAENRLVEFHYRLNIDHYRENGPLFFYIHDLNDASTRWIEEGLMVDVAREVGAALITANHRYTGLNIPTESSSFEDLSFLTVDQAVADIAILVDTLHIHLGTSNPRVVVWGTGYGASLATFARRRYPHLIDAAFASSGNFRADVFDTTYHDNLSSNLNMHGGQACFERVKNAFDVLEYLIQNHEAEYVRQRLGLCNAIDTNDHQEVGLILERFVDLISNYIRENNLFGLQNFCRDMNFFPEDTFNSLIRWAVFNYGGDDGECIDISYADYIEELQETDWDEDFPGARIKMYLRCTQIAAFRIASESDLTAFPSLLDDEYHFTFCEDMLGEQYDRHALLYAVENFNIQFGGQEQIVPFVIFTNAGLDPWISHGVSEHDQENGAAIFINYSVAGRDLTSISADDPFELARAKQQIFETIVRWSERDDDEDDI